MPPEQRERFLANIDVETARLQALSERLLRLAQVEQRRVLEEPALVSLRTMVQELLTDCAPRLQLAQIVAANAVPDDAVVEGERFLLRQALLNLIDNAIEFTPAGGSIEVAAHETLLGDRKALALSVRNEGPPIPDYALARVTERFYSLARPATGRKSTGLGLNFVQEVAQLHGGEFRIANEPDGVRAALVLPAG
jgi:two-component system sensor histidine kinase CreC